MPYTESSLDKQVHHLVSMGTITALLAFCTFAIVQPTLELVVRAQLAADTQWVVEDGQFSTFVKENQGWEWGEPAAQQRVFTKAEKEASVEKEKAQVREYLYSISFAVAQAGGEDGHAAPLSEVEKSDFRLTITEGDTGGDAHVSWDPPEAGNTMPGAYADPLTFARGTAGQGYGGDDGGQQPVANRSFFAPSTSFITGADFGEASELDGESECTMVDCNGSSCTTDCCGSCESGEESSEDACSMVDCALESSCTVDCCGSCDFHGSAECEMVICSESSCTVECCGTCGGGTAGDTGGDTGGDSGGGACSMVDCSGSTCTTSCCGTCSATSPSSPATATTPVMPSSPTSATSPTTPVSATSPTTPTIPASSTTPSSTPPSSTPPSSIPPSSTPPSSTPPSSTPPSSTPPSSTPPSSTPPSSTPPSSTPPSSTPPSSTPPSSTPPSSTPPSSQSTDSSSFAPFLVQ